MSSQVVLITGCSSGIGRDLAGHLTAAGYSVVATARRPETLGDVPAALRLPLDVQRPDTVEAAVNETIKIFGRIDVLVNNAGFGEIGALEEMTDQRLQNLFDVNVFGAMRVTRAVLPHMRRQASGRIINVSSLAGRMAFPFMGAYCASKFALEALSDALRGEVAPFGIQVVLIEPGAIRTAFDRTARASFDPEANPDSPYAPYARGFDRAFALSNRRAPGPEMVSRTIRRAIEARRPRARYQVPASSGWVVRLTALLPDRVLDGLIQRAMRRLARREADPQASAPPMESDR